MAAIRTQALVLRAVDFGESDRIVHLLTPVTGRITAMAKGARRSVKRFPGTLDFFNRLRVQIEPRPRNAMARLDHAALEQAYARMRSDPLRFGLGCYLLELLDRLAPEGGARADTGRLFDFAVTALETLERLAPDATLRVLLELRALEALGLRPELRCCVRCARELCAEAGAAGFHLGEGGPVCPACGAADAALLPVHLGTLRALERSLALDLDRLERLQLPAAALAEARLLVARFQRFHLGVELRSERILDDLLARSEAAAAGPARRDEGRAERVAAAD